jgi:hypothetical protein
VPLQRATRFRTTMKHLLRTALILTALATLAPEGFT